MLRLKTNLNSVLIIAGLIIISAIFKLVPHLPNFSPELVFAAFLGARFSMKWQWFFILLMLIVCDGLYAVISPYPVFGSWTYMTYSGFLLVGLAANYLPINYNRWHFVGFSISAGFLFWLWTNFFVWLSSGIYLHTASGLALCFTAALPFLGYSLLSSLFWGIVIMRGSAFLFSQHFRRITSLRS